MDEIEATGAETIAELEHNIRLHVTRASPWRVAAGESQPRPFAGINVVFLGDFWQMTPVGEIALMGDPFADRALSKAHAGAILAMFWEPEHKNA